MKPVIICIVGASGSGKTLASLTIQEQFGWKAITSYTTRPMRKGEYNGLDHWFVSSDLVPSKERMCAYTKFNNYKYWATWDQFSETTPNLYVIDEKGLIDLQSKETTPFSFQLFTIKIKREDLSSIDKERVDRDKEREQIPDEFYDYIVYNNDTLEAFRANLYLVGQCIKQQIEDYGSTAGR